MSSIKKRKGKIHFYILKLYILENRWKETGPEFTPVINQNKLLFKSKRVHDFLDDKPFETLIQLFNKPAVHIPTCTPNPLLHYT